MGMKKDLGTILTLTAAQILTTYVDATVINGGRPDTIRFMLLAQTKSGSAITSAVLQVLVSQDGVTYVAVASEDDVSLDTGPVHTWAIAAAGTPQPQSVTVPGGYPYIKVQVKALGGIGATGGSLLAIDKFTLTAAAV